MPSPQIHRDCGCMALHFDLHPHCEDHSEEGDCAFFSPGFDKGSDRCDVCESWSRTQWSKFRSHAVSRKRLRSFSSTSDSDSDNQSLSHSYQGEELSSSAVTLQKTSPPLPSSVTAQVLHSPVVTQPTSVAMSLPVVTPPAAESSAPSNTFGGCDMASLFSQFVELVNKTLFLTHITCQVRTGWLVLVVWEP
jgi:hypothetical protein